MIIDMHIIWTHNTLESNYVCNVVCNEINSSTPAGISHGEANSYLFSGNDDLLEKR